jgi:hypothetical protein
MKKNTTLKFPHLENLAKCGGILDAPVVSVTEKIDGFNARFGRDESGRFWVGTRNREIDPAVDKQQGFSDFALSCAAGVPSGTVIFGEWAGRGIQKRLDYGEPSFWFFDGARVVGEAVSWFTLADMDEVAERLSLRRPRCFHVGPPPTVEQLIAWRSTPGIEGVVIRAYPMAHDPHHDGGALIAKFKSPAFSETVGERTQRPPQDLTSVAAFVGEYVTSERLSHVMAQVSESGLDALDVRSTGEVLRAMYADIVREGADDFAALSEDDQKAVGRVCAGATKPLLCAVRDGSL